MTFGALNKYMDAATELGRNPVSNTRFSLSMEMSKLTRDGTAETVSRDQMLRRKWGQGKKKNPVQLTTGRFGNLTRLILTFALCVIMHGVRMLHSRIRGRPTTCTAVVTATVAADNVTSVSFKMRVLFKKRDSSQTKDSPLEAKVTFFS